MIRAASAGRSPRLAVRLLLKQLEEYTLPSSSISGSIWNDPNGDGFRQPPELGLAARVVYLDLNGNGRLNTTTTTRAASSTAIGPAPGRSAARPAVGWPPSRS